VQVEKSQELVSPPAIPNLCSSFLTEVNNKRSSVEFANVFKYKYFCDLIKCTRFRVFTCHAGAVLGSPLRSHSRLCKCHWAAATIQSPNGVHLKTTPCQESHPPAAKSHQSKIDKIVHPVAPQRHLRLILCNLPLLAPLWLFWLLFVLCWWYCWCDCENGLFAIVHLLVHCFGLKFVALEILF